MLTSQQSSTSAVSRTKTSKSKLSARSKPTPSIASWGGLKWFLVWLVGITALSLGLLNIYQVWIKQPQERLIQQDSQRYLNELSEVINSHEGQWRSSLEALANSRLLIIAIAQKSLSKVGSTTLEQTPLRLSPSWIQALQRNLGANAEWHILLSPDALTHNTAENNGAQSFSFTDQLLINGCFQGQTMPTEIHIQQGELLAHQCHKVTMPVSQKLAAPTGFNPILFVRFPIASTLLALQKSPPDFGELVWTQHFDEDEAQVLLSHGLSHIDATQRSDVTNTVNLDNPLWRLHFTHGNGFPRQSINPIVFGAVTVAVLVLFFAFSHFCFRKGSPNYRKMARARFKQTIGFEENLSLIDLATEDMDWVTGGTLEDASKSESKASGSGDNSLGTKQKTKEGSSKARKRFKVHSSSGKTAATPSKNPSENVTLRPVSPSVGIETSSNTKERSDTTIKPATSSTAHNISEKVFRAYDIRGSQTEGVNSELAYRLGVWLGRQSQTVYVGRDCRLSSPELYRSLIQGLSSTQTNTEVLGLVTTPMLNFATALHPFWQLQKTNVSPDDPDVAFDLDTYIQPNNVSKDISSVMITASHNPAEDNGFKLLINGKIPTADHLKALHTALINLECAAPTNTALSMQDPQMTLPVLNQHYIDAISQRNTCPETCRVVIDAGNGATSEIAPALLEEMGCEVIPLNCDFDGHFPNRTPDTSDESQLAALIAIVKQLEADVGFAFDGDGDRLAVVTASGRIVKADELLMIFTRDALSRNPGRDVVFDVKCSRNLVGIISQCGGRPVMSQTGYNYLRQKMQARNAILGGDFSGHIYFTDNWIGSDDGLFAAARLLDILDQTQLPLDDLIASLPNSYSTPEIRINLAEEEKVPLLEQLLHSDEFASGKVTTIDGIRVDYPKSWGLVRASNTSACLTLRFEGSSEAELARVQFYFTQALLKVKPDLDIPF